MKIHKVEQRTDEWHAIRRGRMTGSEAQCIATNGKGLETYINKIVVEKITGKSVSTFVGNAHTERGNELEPDARLSYELINDVTVEEVGFIEEDEFVGVSPDGLVGEDGGIEIKCPDDVKYFKLLIGDDKPDEAYIWQCQMFLRVSGRKWIDLVYYNPNFNKSTLIFRIEPELYRQEKLTIGIEKGKILINNLLQKYEQTSRNLPSWNCRA